MAGRPLTQSAPIPVPATPRTRRPSPARAARARTTAAQESIRQASEPLEETSNPVLVRIARFLYYLGAASIGLLTLQPHVPGFSYGSANVSDLLFLACFGLACLGLLLTRGVFDFRLPGMLLVGVGLFSLGAVISSANTLSPLQSILQAVRLDYILLAWVWLGSVVLRTKRQLTLVILLWTMSAAISGFSALVQVATAGPDGNGRAIGYFAPHPAHLGGLCAIALVPALAMIFHPGAKWPRMAFTTLIVMGCGVGMILSGSIGSMIGAGTGIAIWMLGGRLSQKTIASVLITGAVLFAAISIQQARNGTSPLQRLSQATGSVNEGTSTLKLRIDNDRDVWNVIVLSPFVGNGVPADASELDVGGNIHNTPLAFWYIAGFPAFLGVILVFLSGAIGAVHLIRRVDREYRHIAVALAGSLAASFVYGLSAELVFTRYAWYPLALIIAWRALVRRSGASVSAEARPLLGTRAGPRSSAQPAVR